MSPKCIEEIPYVCVDVAYVSNKSNGLCYRQETGVVHPEGRKDSEIVIVGRFTQLRSDKAHTWYLCTGDQLGRM